MAADFMPLLNRFFQHRDVLIAPINFPPFIPTAFMGRLLVGDQKECRWNAVVVEDREGSLKLAPKPIIESKRDKRWHDLF